MSNNLPFIAPGEARPPFFAGIDLGGQSIKVGIVDDLGRPLSKLVIPTESQAGPEAAAARMGQAVRDAIAKAGVDPASVVRVGLGSPGTMDIRAGKLIRPSNLRRSWDNFPLRDRAAAHCRLPVTFANDANAAAYGEFWVGAGRDFHSLVLFTLGTGIGCGIIIGDLSIDGENSHGGECGHIVIDCSPTARLCGCRQRGHLEAYAGAVAVAKRAREALEVGRQSSLEKRLADGHALTPKLLAEEAAAGDALSREIIADTAHFLAIGIVNVMNTIDPSGVLLGGAMTFGSNDSPLGKQFLQWVREEVARLAFPVLAKRTVIEFASLGGDAGFIGAAGLARIEHRNAAR